MNVRHLIERHFGLILILSCVAGLVVPGIERIPNESVVAALAALMFVSCYRLHEGGFSTIRWRDIVLFYGLRYAALPIALMLIIRAVAPNYATSVFLLSVLPAGVASPAFAGMYGGALPPSFAIVILSQIAAPFLIPLMFMLFGDSHIHVEPSHLFMTMVWCILMPMLVYIFTRRHRRSGAYIYKHGKLASVLLIAFMIALAVSKQREVILSSGIGLLATLGMSFLCYACYIAFGWLLKRPRDIRIAYSSCSAFNNAGLGVSLALLYFPPPVILFMASSEIIWAILPLMMKGWLKVMNDKTMNDATAG